MLAATRWRIASAAAGCCVVTLAWYAILSTYSSRAVCVYRYLGDSEPGARSSNDQSISLLEDPGGLSQYFIIGMTTVARDRGTYLNATLHSLQCGLSSDHAQPTVLVLNGEFPSNRHPDFLVLWRQKYIQDFMRKGLMLLSMGHLHHALLNANASGGLPLTHGDPPERVYWRSKENLDKAYLIEAALQVSRGAKYYLQIEDDLRFAPHFLGRLQSFIRTQQGQGRSVDVVSLYGESGLKGSQAIAYRVGLLQEFVNELRQKFYHSPYDWMLEDFRRHRNLSLDIIVPNLVQHIGIYSSLANKKIPHTSLSFNDSGFC